MKTTPSIAQIFIAFLTLGCTSFGGPVAHLAFFNEAFVKRRQWIDQQAYAHLMSLCHFIPGPSSSQVGLGIGYSLRGWQGACAAWLGFTLPSALLMGLVAVGLLSNAELLSSQAIHYLKIVALVVVVQAIWQMSKVLLLNTLSRCLCLLGAAILLLVPGVSTQLLVLVVMGVIGWVYLKPEDIQATDELPEGLRYRSIIVGCGVFVLVFMGLFLAATFIDQPIVALIDSMFRTGSLVFGGGHVVLPVMQQEAMVNSSIDSEVFLAGYGLAQALPGPLFTFATYVGALWLDSSPWLGALVATFAIFLPSFILVPALLPVWQSLQYHRSARAVVAGLNVGVIGFLIATFYQPLLINTIFDAGDVAIALVVFCGVVLLKLPAWAFVIAALVLGSLF